MLPEMAGGRLRPAGPAEAHLAGCAACALEYARFRSVIEGLRSLADHVVEPSADLPERIIAGLPSGRVRVVASRVAANDQARVALLSLGGAAIGAVAVGLLWWRRTRRALGEATATVQASVGTAARSEAAL